MLLLLVNACSALAILTKYTQMAANWSRAPSVLVSTVPGLPHTSQWSIKPDGYDLQLHTVLRTELVALLYGILFAHPDHDIHVFTDASTALFLVRLVLHTPERLRINKHRALLTMIAHAICCRATSNTIHLHKVRAHIGVTGNEKADQLAKAAAALELDEDDAATPSNVTPPTGNTCSCLFKHAHALHPSIGTNWVQHLVLHEPAEGEVKVEWQNVDNLKQPIKTQSTRVHTSYIRKHSGLMITQLFTLHHSPPGILPQSFTTQWHPSFPQKLCRAGLDFRFDTWLLRKHRHRYEPLRFPSDHCVLCPAGIPEGLAHALGQCMHPNTHALVCRRHGDSVHIIKTALTQHRNCVLLEDAEGHARISYLPNGKYYPWLLPSGNQLSKPDLLVIPTLEAHHTALTREARQAHTVLLLEWFHTYDANLHARQRVREHDHDGLAHELRQAGWKAVLVFSMGIGHSGLLPGNFPTFLTACGLPASRHAPLITALVRHTLFSNMRLLAIRAQAERALAHPPHTAAHAALPPDPEVAPMLTTPPTQQTSVAPPPAADAPESVRARTRGCTRRAPA